MLARGEISQRFEDQRVVERLPNGDVIIKAAGRSDFFIVRTLLRYAGNVELPEPVCLRSASAYERRSTARYNGSRNRSKSRCSPAVSSPDSRFRSLWEAENPHGGLKPHCGLALRQADGALGRGKSGQVPMQTCGVPSPVG